MPGRAFLPVCPACPVCAEMPWRSWSSEPLTGAVDASIAADRELGRQSPRGAVTGRTASSPIGRETSRKPSCRPRESPMRSSWTSTASGAGSRFATPRCCGRSGSAGSVGSWSERRRRDRRWARFLARASRDPPVDRSQGSDTQLDARRPEDRRRTLPAHIVVAYVVGPVTGTRAVRCASHAIGRQPPAAVDDSTLAIPGCTSRDRDPRAFALAIDDRATATGIGGARGMGRDRTHRVAELEESGITGFIVDDLQLIEQARKHRDAPATSSRPECHLGVRAAAVANAG